MPNRLIRSDLLDSDRYWACTAEARELYIHMLLLADDCACVSIAPAFIGRRAFFDRPSTEKLAKLLGELVDQDLIRLYRDSPEAPLSFAFIPRFGQRLQRTTLKHPPPPESCYSDDKHATAVFNKIKEKAKNSTVGQQKATVGQPPEVEVEVEVEDKTLKPSMSGSPANADAEIRKAKLKELNATAVRILQFLNDKRVNFVGMNARGFAAKNENLQSIRARLCDGFTEQEIKAVIANRCREWKEKRQMHQYLRPSTLFNKTKFGEYYANLPARKEASDHAS